MYYLNYCIKTVGEIYEMYPKYIFGNRRWPHGIVIVSGSESAREMQYLRDDTGVSDLDLHVQVN
jgi:hypothetical protein